MAEHSFFTRLVRGLPRSVPFVGPEAIERADGRALALRLGANESMFGPSPRARAAMRAAAEGVWMYGDPESFDLRVELAHLHGVTIENLVIGSGIDELLAWIARAVLEPGDVAVTSRGTYPTFNYLTGGFAGRLVPVPYLRDRPDLDALLAAVERSGARLVYLANPDNPTGSWHGSAGLAAFVDRLPDHCMLALDEAYVDFAPPRDVLPIDVTRANVLRLRTFSKAHGMAGARIGYAVGHGNTVAAFEKIRLHFGVNRVAQAGALASAADSEYLHSVVDSVRQGREDYLALARSLGLPALPSMANFVAFDLGTRERAQAVLQGLAARGVFARTGSATPLDRLVRVTVAPAAQRAAFADVLKDVCTQMSGVAAPA